MLSKEMGPLDVFARLRAFLARKQKKSGGFYDMVSCVGCNSIWIALIISLMTINGPVGVIMGTLSFSAVALVIERLTSK